MTHPIQAQLCGTAFCAPAKTPGHSRQADHDSPDFDSHFEPSAARDPLTGTTQGDGVAGRESPGPDPSDAETGFDPPVSPDVGEIRSDDAADQGSVQMVAPTRISGTGSDIPANQSPGTEVRATQGRADVAHAGQVDVQAGVTVPATEPSAPSANPRSSEQNDQGPGASAQPATRSAPDSRMWSNIPPTHRVIDRATQPAPLTVVPGESVDDHVAYVRVRGAERVPAIAVTPGGSEKPEMAVGGPGTSDTRASAGNLGLTQAGPRRPPGQGSMPLVPSPVDPVPSTGHGIQPSWNAAAPNGAHTPQVPVLAAVEIADGAQPDSIRSLGIDTLPPLAGEPDFRGVPNDPARAPVRVDSARPALPQILDALGRSAGGTLVLAFSPEELGQVRMALTGTEAGFHLSILSDRVETLDLMRRHASELAQALHHLGYDSVDLAFSHQGSARPDAGGNPGRAPETDSPADDALVRSPALPGMPPALSTGLDVRI